MKKPTKASLRALGILNEHILARRGPEPQVYVAYRAQDRGRVYQSAAWQVIQVGFKSDHDPKAFWRDQGHKTFNVYDYETEKMTQFAAAQAWASDRYHIPVWERSPWGSYHPAGTIAYAVARAAQEKEMASI